MNALSLRFRNTRRGVVTAHYLSFGLAVFLINLHVYTNAVGLALICAGAIYLLTGICLVTITLPYGISGVRWKPSPKIDERQRRVRADALAYSYWITSLLVFLAYLWSAAAGYLHSIWRPRDTSEWSWIFWSGVMLNCMLPAAIIAWNEPDMPTEAISELSDHSPAESIPASR